MGFATSLIGGALGFTAQVMSNSIQKIPLSRQPWMHVICTGGGAWAANKWSKTETELLMDINEIRAYKGLPPMVGTKYYAPLVPPSQPDDS
eukprot:CAMPEP_0119562458 /NCGR_PEP_ID=MMETSP1352-20130426/20483_1 /TAXON_ID=265584 /ORGANISM="Stauroneis constricta, Strain CCMP1120" /LENGTH=90 /DNA_ID=CAMNT_0007610865 /DNA_START=12 /DNA_END=284 /DNA_ORIENTATION=-